jgi:hypothetical protein
MLKGPSRAAVAVALLAAGAGTGCADGHRVTPAGAQPSRPPAVASPSRTVPGMYLYRYADANGATVNDVLYRAPGGGGWRPVATVKGPATPTPPRLAVSPDHRLVAWILGGLLRVGALDGSRVTIVADGVGNPSCQAPTWTADSRRLLFVTTPPNTIQVVDADGTGRHVLGTTPEPAGCGDLASTDGDTVYALVRTGGKAKLVAFGGGTGAGDAERAVAATWPPGQQLSEVLAASPGVTRLLVTTVDSAATCCGTPADRYAVVDPGTGRVTGLDNANDTQASIAVSGAFAADGRVVLIADHYRAEGAGEFGRGSAGDHQEFLTVYAPDGTVLGGADLPSLGYGYLVGLDG